MLFSFYLLWGSVVIFEVDGGGCAHGYSSFVGLVAHHGDCLVVRFVLGTRTLAVRQVPLGLHNAADLFGHAFAVVIVHEYQVVRYVLRLCEVLLASDPTLFIGGDARLIVQVRSCQLVTAYF